MRTIAIAAGGDSPEYEVSVKSAREVHKALSGRYNSYIIVFRGTNWYWEDEKGRCFSVDKNDFTLKLDDLRVRFDAVFIAIHGTPGENGLLQGYLDIMGIPYTTCGAFTSALTFNKQATKLYLKEYGIKMAEALLVRRGENIDSASVTGRIGLPCFVKPNDSGSSFGVSKVLNSEDLVPAVDKALNESEWIMIESFMKGREVACGVVKTKNRKLILPVTEIITDNEFFDYEAKYTVGKSREITPGEFSGEVTEKIQSLSSEIYDLLGCNGIARIDFIVIDDHPWFLEVNTVPGMSSESILPKQARAAGLTEEELYSMVIEDLF